MATTLSKEEKLLVNKTFYQIAPISDRASERFYSRLFEVAPAMRDLFSKADMREQRKKLIDMVALVVYSLENIDKVKKALHSLGDRHVEYGVKLEDYTTVGDAFLWMLEQELGEDYTPETAAAWTKTWQLMTEIATEAVRPV